MYFVFYIADPNTSDAVTSSPITKNFSWQTENNFLSFVVLTLLKNFKKTTFLFDYSMFVYLFMLDSTLRLRYLVFYEQIAQNYHSGQHGETE